MAHEITNSDGLFVVRQEAWHGLGTVLADYPTRAEAQAIAHPWEPESEPLYRKRVRLQEVPHSHDRAQCYPDQASCIKDGPDFSDELWTESFEVAETTVLNVRSDNQAELGAVSKTYTTVTNGEMWDVAEAIEGVDKAEVKYETGGSLAGGKKVWLLLRLVEPITVAGDPNGGVIPYYALQNAHDGSGSFRGSATFVRVVCANTAQMADLDARARGTEFVFQHTKNVGDRIEEAKKALAGWRSSVQAFQDQSAYLLSLGVDLRQRELFLEKFIPMPAGKVVSDRVARNIEEARDAVRWVLKGKTCEGIDNTAYGLVQGSIEYLNHIRKAHTEESRFKRAYLDRNSIVTHVVKLAQEASNA